MDITETGILLAKIQAYDNRNVADPTIIAWQEILEPHTLPDCLDAVRRHYRAESKWIMPADVRHGVLAIEERRLNTFTDGLHLAPSEERGALTGGNWQVLNRKLFRAAATGTFTPAEYTRYVDGDLALDDLLGQAAIR